MRLYCFVQRSAAILILHIGVGTAIHQELCVRGEDMYIRTVSDNTGVLIDWTSRQPDIQTHPDQFHILPFNGQV